MCLHWHRRQTVAAAKHAQTANVIDMLMGDENRVDIADIHADFAKVGFYARRAYAGVHQNAKRRRMRYKRCFPMNRKTAGKVSAA